MSTPGDLRIEEAGEKHLGDLALLFGSQQYADRCWCMWFLIPVKQYHAEGREGNRRRFAALVNSEQHPMGLLAYQGAKAVGWCAAGPRSRYERAVKTPTMRERHGDDDQVWLVPCFFIHPDHREEGIAASLLAGAVEFAKRKGASAIEGFPLAGSKRRSGGSDLMTGVEPLFENAGFSVDHRPSNNRVVMRREL